MAGDEQTGERIAKAISRAGLMSRRDAEKAILAGRVAVNGKPVASPALDVTARDRVTVDGKPIDAPQDVRLWLYYKPLGLIVSEKDEKGRQTVFDTLPEGMPRVMSVGRLDLNSEGLLLLTNDGGLKRRLEMPATGWLRKYRVRVMGSPTEAMLAPLRDGITIDGEEFQPMEITIDHQRGANAWLTVGIREGKNREVRRAMAEIGLNVNRLIRVSYGPFRLNDMKPGEISELRRKVLRDQLGGLLTGEEDATPSRKRKPGDRAGADRPRKPRTAAAAGDRPDRKPRAAAAGGERPARGFAGKPGGERPDRKPRAAAAGGDRPA
ncbi:MAG: rRNA pseudouridine synthase, partial [Rhodobacteraceae bacterium]|nr:rRNA pseudouridine synthase [Paracoccaceae bacterium]